MVEAVPREIERSRSGDDNGKLSGAGVIAEDDVVEAASSLVVSSSCSEERAKRVLPVFLKAPDLASPLVGDGVAGPVVASGS